MNVTSYIALACMMFVGQFSTPRQDKSAAKITGDYVEVRTASVFAGACHYNGELTTTGRDAVLAMNISSGSWNGADLSGVRVMACITATDNLGIDTAIRKSEIVVDSSATAKQAAAAAGMLKSKFQNSFGEIVSVRRAAINFKHDSNTYNVTAAGVASYNVEAMPNAECCKQPQLVWYSPLLPIEDRKVGYTASASYSAGTISDRWQRTDENSAIYGTFAF